MALRGVLLVLVGGWALAVGSTSATLLALFSIERVTRPRWVRRAVLRRDLRALAAYRRRLRGFAADAERRYRAGDLADNVGRQLAACAVLLDDCDREIDRTLDALDAARR